MTRSELDKLVYDVSVRCAEETQGLAAEELLKLDHIGLEDRLMALRNELRLYASKVVSDTFAQILHVSDD